MVDDNLWHFQSGINSKEKPEKIQFCLESSVSHWEIYEKKKLGILLKDHKSLSSVPPSFEFFSF